jgi:hypothetical protein
VSCCFTHHLFSYWQVTYLFTSEGKSQLFDLAGGCVVVLPEKEYTFVSNSEVDNGINQCNFSVPVNVDE